MIADVLREHLDDAKKPSVCSMGRWILMQESEIQELFAQISEKKNVNAMALYRSLEAVLPCKCTTFKLHIKGNCSCPKA